MMDDVQKLWLKGLREGDAMLFGKSKMSLKKLSVALQTDLWSEGRKQYTLLKEWAIKPTIGDEPYKWLNTNAFQLKGFLIKNYVKE